MAPSDMTLKGQTEGQSDFKATSRKRAKLAVRPYVTINHK